MTLSSVGSVPFALIAGLTASMGPCLVPRLLMVSSLAGGKSFAAPIAYCSGIVCGYVTLGVAAESIRIVAGYTSMIYAGMACVLAVAGALKVLLDSPHACERKAAYKTSLGASILAGFASSAVASPCCGSLAIAIGAQSGMESSIVAVAAFSAGHVLPVLVGARASSWLRGVVTSPTVARAYATVVGALMIALAGYYAVLS